MSSELLLKSHLRISAGTIKLCLNLNPLFLSIEFVAVLNFQSIIFVLFL